MNGALLIGVTEAKLDAQREPTLEGKLRAAMRTMRDHWMVTNEEEQFRCAVAAVMTLVDDDERARLEREMRALNAIGAAITAASSGVRVDIAGTIAEHSNEGQEPPIGLLNIWREVKA